VVPLFFICKHTDALIASVTGRPAFSYFSILGVQKKNSEGSWENAVSCLAPSGRSLKNLRLLLFLINISFICFLIIKRIIK
jgi:hypothetical protein